MPAEEGRKIAIVGGSGQVGTHILSSLVARGIHTLTAISRPDSASVFPHNVTVKRGAYDDEAFLVSALQGQEVLVLALSFGSVHFQESFIRAAAKAGVSYVLPTEYGPDPDPSTKLYQALPLVQSKKPARDLIEELGLTWIAIVTNPWLDSLLPATLGVWGIDFAGRKARLYDGGDAKFVAGTLVTTGQGTAGLLSLPGEELARYHNKPLYLQAFRISQRELVQSVIRTSGTAEEQWHIAEIDTDKVVEEARQLVAEGNQVGFVTEFYADHMRAGYGGDWGHKVDEREMARLGVVSEDLDTVMKKIWVQLQAGGDSNDPLAVVQEAYELQR